MKTIRRNVCLALAIGLAIATQNARATFLRGQPYIPTNADFTISAVQGINPANPTGASGFHPQVNGDFEFKDSIGVSWDDGTGKLKDFGLGLYQDNSKNTFSTGLQINYNQLVQASSVTITVEDFDIQPGKDTAFNPKKVEPGILIFGQNGNVFANLNPTQIFPYLKPNTSAGQAKGDVWDLNFGDVLSGLKLADGPISGFLLYADMLNGEQANSDPYLLVAIGNGIPQVPEPASYLAIIAVLLMLGGSHLTVLRRKRATV
ncbi:MAG TPA: hypothetical protein VFF11_02855 [Candidatus Binatia bacterium]|nr:hypothetical protein [Candidatus Binatia bacterium]